jgi:hypothetical protein
MEGGDMLGAYERACEMAELNARMAGIVNPVSAWHARKLPTSHAHGNPAAPVLEPASL